MSYESNYKHLLVLDIFWLYSYFTIVMPGKFYVIGDSNCKNKLEKCYCNLKLRKIDYYNFMTSIIVICKSCPDSWYRFWKRQYVITISNQLYNKCNLLPIGAEFDIIIDTHAMVH